MSTELSNNENPSKKQRRAVSGSSGNGSGNETNDEHQTRLKAEATAYALSATPSTIIPAITVGSVHLLEKQSSGSSHYLTTTTKDIVTKFPDVLKYILPYIRDRNVWDAIAQCNKSTYEYSKEDRLIPPWPTNKRLKIEANDDEFGHDKIDIHQVITWSPDGTKIAYEEQELGMVQIFDQRNGLIQGGNIDTETASRRSYTFRHGRHYKRKSLNMNFSPDSRILCTFGGTSLQLWNIDDSTENCKMLVELKGMEFFGKITHHPVTFSHCSNYIAYLDYDNGWLDGGYLRFKEIRNNNRSSTGTISKSFKLPMFNSYANMPDHQPKFVVAHDIYYICFTKDHHSILILCIDLQIKKTCLKIWRPFNDENIDGKKDKHIKDESNGDLLTIFEYSSNMGMSYFPVLSPNGQMIAVVEKDIVSERYDGEKMILSVLSIDDKSFSVVHSKIIIDKSIAVISDIQFSPDDKYIMYKTNSQTNDFINEYIMYKTDSSTHEVKNEINLESGSFCNDSCLRYHRIELGMNRELVEITEDLTKKERKALEDTIIGYYHKGLDGHSFIVSPNGQNVIVKGRKDKDLHILDQCLDRSVRDIILKDDY